jgi:hypothetical protein
MVLQVILYEWTENIHSPPISMRTVGYEGYLRGIFAGWGYAHMLHHPVKPGGGPTTKAVIFAQLVTDYCRFETIRDSGDANAIPKCPEDLHYWANATRLRWR